MEPAPIHRVLAILGLLAAAASVVPAAPPTAEVRSQLESLIRELDADDRATRARAVQGILDLGPDVLPLLPPPELVSTAQARETLEQVRTHLEQTQARRSLEPALLTLEGEFLLAELLKQMEAQSGNRCRLDPALESAGERPVAIAWDGVSFWRALDQLAEQTALSLKLDETLDAVVLVSHEAQSPPARHVSYDGAFRTTAAPAVLRPIYGSPQQLLVRSQLELWAEPRLRPLFLRYKTSDLKATGPAGAQFQPFTPEANYELPLGERGHSANLPLDFVISADRVPNHIAVEGQVELEVAAGSERIEFTSLPTARGVARRRGGVTVTLDQVDFQPPGQSALPLQIQVSVSYDAGGPAFESHRTWILHNEVVLEGPEGTRAPDSFRTASQSDGGAAIQYLFDDLPGPPDALRFVYVAPTLVVDVPVDFQFDRVPVVRPGITAP